MTRAKRRHPPSDGSRAAAGAAGLARVALGAVVGLRLEIGVTTPILRDRYYVENADGSRITVHEPQALVPRGVLALEGVWPPRGDR